MVLEGLELGCGGGEDILRPPARVCWFTGDPAVVLEEGPFFLIDDRDRHGRFDMPTLVFIYQERRMKENGEGWMINLSMNALKLYSLRERIGMLEHF